MQVYVTLRRGERAAADDGAKAAAGCLTGSAGSEATSLRMTNGGRDDRRHRSGAVGSRVDRDVTGQVA